MKDRRERAKIWDCVRPEGVEITSRDGNMNVSEYPKILTDEDLQKFDTYEYFGNPQHTDQSAAH